MAGSRHPRGLDFFLVFFSVLSEPLRRAPVKYPILRFEPLILGETGPCRSQCQEPCHVRLVSRISKSSHILIPVQTCTSNHKVCRLRYHRIRVCSFFRILPSEDISRLVFLSF